MSGYCKDCGNQHCVCEETKMKKIQMTEEQTPVEGAEEMYKESEGFIYSLNVANRMPFLRKTIEKQHEAIVYLKQKMEAMK